MEEGSASRGRVILVLEFEAAEEGGKGGIGVGEGDEEGGAGVEVGAEGEDEKREEDGAGEVGEEESGTNGLVSAPPWIDLIAVAMAAAEGRTCLDWERERRGNFSFVHTI